MNKLLTSLVFSIGATCAIAQNVGINTTAPASKLAVNGNTTIGSAYTSTTAPANGLLIQGNTGINVTNPLSRLAVGGNFSVGSSYAGINAPTNGAIIQGNVGIGTSNPDEHLHVYQNGRAVIKAEGDQRGYINAAVLLQANQPEFNKRGLGIFMYDVTGQNEWFAGRPYSSSDCFVIQRLGSITQHQDDISAIVDGMGNALPTDRLLVVESNGNVGIGVDFATSDKLIVDGTASKPGGGSWAVYSDRRLKKDIKPFNDGLETILKINPVRFKYNEKAQIEDTNKEYIGIIAQEIQKVAPYTVEEKQLSTDDKYLQFDPSSIDFMLINAVKTLKQENEALKARLEKLEKELGK